MKCPIDGADLLMSDRNGIEIDYCPKCRGVWLDRGELDKIIERSNSEIDKIRTDPEYRNEGYYRDDARYKDDDYYKRKKKKGFFGDMFEFD